MSPVNCLQCQHYYVTWDKKHPHGCRKMGFKSHQIPNLVVRRNSSKDCLLFKPRVAKPTWITYLLRSPPFLEKQQGGKNALPGNFFPTMKNENDIMPPPPTGNGPGPGLLDSPIGRFLLPIGGGLCWGYFDTSFSYKHPFLWDQPQRRIKEC